MKKLIKKSFLFLLIGTLILLQFSISVSAEDSSHWFMKRNGNKRPICPQEEKLAEKYDAYYLDQKVSDDSDDKVIYLTFDAGYENGNVKKILDILNKEDVKAAFFVLSEPIVHHTELVKEMKETGHLVCNHTKNHKNMTKLTSEEMKKNLTDLEKLCSEYAGFDLDKYFRFPEGQFNEETLKTAQALGYKTIFWSFGYADWDNGKQPDPEKAKKLILDNTHNGEVILLHPTSQTNVTILPQLITEWKSMGYRFGTLDELCR